MAISSLSDACIIIVDAQSARLKLHKRVGAQKLSLYHIVLKEFFGKLETYIDFKMSWELERLLDLNKSFAEFFYAVTMLL